MYGARVLMRPGVAAGRSFVWETDDIGVLRGQALVDVLDDCQRAVGAEAIKFERATGF